MNYFEFYDIPVTFNVDATALKRIYYANSKKYHPDFYTLATPDKQAEILELSTLNNEAYQTLSDFDKRMAYILQLKGELEEGQNSIPQDFLMEVMDINEALMELEFDYDEAIYQKTKDAVIQLNEELMESVTPLLASYDTNTAETNDLEKIKLFFLKKRYLLRIFKNLSKFATA